MDFNKLVAETRSFRRFNPEAPISREILKNLVDLGRITASGSNLQPIKYITANAPEWNARIYSTLGWAGYLKDWPGPAEGERPTGYILLCTDTNIREDADTDIGIVAQTILLGAVSRKFGGCMIGSIQRDRLRELLDVPEHLKITLVIALGKPSERVILEEVRDTIKYYRSADQVHHVPKRNLDEVLYREF